jgi:alkaline phosphatase
MATAGQYKGQTLLAQAQARGYQVVSNADQLTNSAQPINNNLF